MAMDPTPSSFIDANDWSPRISFSHNPSLLDRISRPKENHPIPADFGFEFSSYLTTDLQLFEQRMMSADELFCNGKLRPLARRCENARDLGVIQGVKTNGKMGDGGRCREAGGAENTGDGGARSRCRSKNTMQSDGGRSPISREEAVCGGGSDGRSISPRCRDERGSVRNSNIGDGDGRSISPRCREEKGAAEKRGSDGERSIWPRCREQRDRATEAMSDGGRSPKSRKERAGDGERRSSSAIRDLDAECGGGAGRSSFREIKLSREAESGDAPISKGAEGAGRAKPMKLAENKLLYCTTTTLLNSVESAQAAKKKAYNSAMKAASKSCSSSHIDLLKLESSGEEDEAEEMKKISRNPRCASMAVEGRFCQHHSHKPQQQHHQKQQQKDQHHHHYMHHRSSNKKLLHRNSISLNNSRCPSPSRSFSSLPCTAPASPTSSSSSRFLSSSSSSRYCNRVMDFLKLKKMHPSSPTSLSSSSRRNSTSSTSTNVSTSTSTSTTPKLAISPRYFWPFSKPKNNTPSSSPKNSHAKSRDDRTYVCTQCRITKNLSYNGCTNMYPSKNLGINGSTNMYPFVPKAVLSPFPLSHASTVNKSARKSAGDQASMFMPHGKTDAFMEEEQASDCDCMKESTTKNSIALHPYSINYFQQGKRRIKNVDHRESMMVGSRGVAMPKGMERSIPYASSVRVTPILNVPGCMTPSLKKTKGSSKSKSMGFGKLFTSKQNVSMAYNLIHSNGGDYNA